MKDQSAIKGNLSQINAFLMAKQGLMELDQIRPILVSHFGHFWLGPYVKAKRGERKKKKKEKVWITMYLWICREMYGLL